MSNCETNNIPFEELPPNEMFKRITATIRALSSTEMSEAESIGAARIMISYVRVALDSYQTNKKEEKAKNIPLELLAAKDRQ